AGGVALEAADLLAGRQVPRADDAAGGAGERDPAVGRDRDAGGAALVAGQREDDARAVDLPVADAGVGAAGQGELAVGRHRGRLDAAGEPLDAAGLLAVAEVPDAYRLVVAPGE